MKLNSESSSRGSKRQSRSRLLVVSCIAFLSVCMATAQTVTKLTIAPASVVGGKAAVGTISLSKKAGTDGLVVALSSSDPSASVSNTVVVPKGAASATFPITTVAVAKTTTPTITASVGDFSKTASLTVKAPSLISVILAPTSVPGGATATGTVKISSPAPSNGLSVSLASNSSSVQVPESALVSSGATSATFTVATTSVGAKTTAKVTATLATTSIAAVLTVNPAVLVSVSLNPASVLGGTTSTGIVTLSGIAPEAGAKVTLTSSLKSATVPPSVTVEAGATSAEFEISTVAVTAQAVAKISVKLGSMTAAANLTITAQPKSPYAGTFFGSFCSEPDGPGVNGIGPVTLKIDTLGAISGTAVDYSSGVARQQQITGSVTLDGNLTITASGNGQSNTNSGTATLIGKSFILCQLTSTGASGGSTTVALTVAGAALQYSGSYSGTLLTSNNNTGTVSLKITAAGTLSGSGKIGSTPLTLGGTVSRTGVSSPVPYYFAFDPSDKLIMLIINSDGTTTIGTLTLNNALLIRP